ncbi:MAG: cupin domain-containing protein, partial [Pseudomonadota bacterium]
MPLKPIADTERRVVNVADGEFKPFLNEDGTEGGGSVLQLDPSKPLGAGFHLYRMDPGTKSTAHEHMGLEQFYVIEGELIDNDGTVYRPGDLVCLDEGTDAKQ